MANELRDILHPATETPAVDETTEAWDWILFACRDRIVMSRVGHAGGFDLSEAVCWVKEKDLVKLMTEQFQGMPPPAGQFLFREGKLVGVAHGEGGKIVSSGVKHFLDGTIGFDLGGEG